MRSPSDFISDLIDTASRGTDGWVTKAGKLTWKTMDCLIDIRNRYSGDGGSGGSGDEGLPLPSTIPADIRMMGPVGMILLMALAMLDGTHCFLI